MTLVEFLLARIAEDEECARGATSWHEEEWCPTWMASGIWHLMRNVDMECFDHDEDSSLGNCGRPHRYAGEHVARWDPARVLAECEAKRRIVTEFGSECSDYGAPGSELRAEREQLAIDIDVPFEPHWPEKYAPFCDGCAAAQSADNDHARVLRILALPYARHPDFREEWKV